MEFEIKPCKTKATFSVKPRKNVSLDMERLSGMFTPKKITPIAGVFEYNGEEFVVQRYGTITFKTSKDEKLIKKIAEMVYEK